MIDQTKWGIVRTPAALNASGQLEVIARFRTKVEATHWKRMHTTRRGHWAQFIVMRVA